MTARIRYFCTVGPLQSETERTFGQSYRYLCALRDTGLGVRALPIGAAFLHLRVPRDSPWAPWLSLMELFTTPIGSGYVNVVCAQPGLVMGKRIRLRDVMPPGHLRPRADALEAEVEEEDVYVPGTAFAQLLTVGVPNVAIVGVEPRPPEKEEARAIKAYDLVLAPDMEAAEALMEHGIDAAVIGPHAAELEEILRAVMP